MERKEKNNFITIGIILIVIGVLGIIVYSVVSLNEYLNTSDDVNDYINSTSNSNDEIVVDKTTISDEEVEDEIEEEIVVDPKATFLVLEIPRIKLKRNIYNFESKYNDVEYNIQILEGSDTPDVVEGNTIFAAHNGNSRVSYFNKLYKLKVNDEINIYYEGMKYVYKFVKVYDIKKDGVAEVYRDKTKTSITLITCKKNIKNKQEVYIGYFDRCEEY